MTIGNAPSDQWPAFPGAERNVGSSTRLRSGTSWADRRSPGFALRLAPAERGLRPTSMDDKPDNVPGQTRTLPRRSGRRGWRTPSAPRRSRICANSKSARLARSKARSSPSFDQAPPGVDMFDLTLTQGEHPRLFLDMVAFVDMARDRRTYRFFQDTLHGRVLIAESQQVDAHRGGGHQLCRASAGRARAGAGRGLAGGWRAAAATRTEADGPRAWPIAKPRAPLARRRPAGSSRRRSRPAAPAAQRRRGFARRLGDALSLFLMTLGSITLALFSPSAPISPGRCASARSLGALDRRAAVLNGPRGHDHRQHARADNPRSPASSQALKAMAGGKS